MSMKHSGGLAPVKTGDYQDTHDASVEYGGGIIKASEILVLSTAGGLLRGHSQDGGLVLAIEKRIRAPLNNKARLRKAPVFTGAGSHILM